MLNGSSSTDTWGCAHVLGEGQLSSQAQMDQMQSNERSHGDSLSTTPAATYLHRRAWARRLQRQQPSRRPRLHDQQQPPGQLSHAALWIDSILLPPFVSIAASKSAIAPASRHPADANRTRPPAQRTRSWTSIIFRAVARQRRQGGTQALPIGRSLAARGARASAGTWCERASELTMEPRTWMLAKACGSESRQGRRLGPAGCGDSGEGGGIADTSSN